MFKKMCYIHRIFESCLKLMLKDITFKVYYRFNMEIYKIIKIKNERYQSCFLLKRLIQYVLYICKVS